MTKTERNLGIGCVVGALTIGVLLFFLVRGKHAEDIADARFDVQHQQAAEEDKHLVQRSNAVQADTQAQVAAIEKRTATVKTASQAVEALPNVLPLPEPVQIVDETNAPKLGDVIFPQADIKPLYDALAERQVLKVQLGGADQQLEIAQQRIEEISKDRDAAVVALKGGTKWKRTWTALKWTAIGAGVGFAVAHR